MLRLAQIRRAGEQRQLAIGAEIEALEKAEAEGVIAREIIHALLLEHEQAVEIGFLHGGNCRGDALPVFGRLEMKCHECP